MTMREGAALIGLAPFTIERVRLGATSAVVARLLGSGCTQSLTDIPAAPNHRTKFIHNVIETLIRQERCDAVVLGPMVEPSPTIDAVHHALTDLEETAYLARDRVVGRRAAIQLSGSFDDYVAQLSKNMRSNVRKTWRRLCDQFDVAENVASGGPECLGEFDRFVALHEQQWRHSGRLGHFTDWPGSTEFHRALVAGGAQSNQVRLASLAADGETIARQYAWRLGNRAECRLAARTLDPQWASYGVGLASLMSLVRSLAQEGVEMIDLGLGTYGYKARLANALSDVRSMVVCRGSRAARRRVRRLLFLGDALDALYYRLWRRRIEPRLPISTGPLWRWWINTRF